ncbi:MAG TPA: hypothetical protein VMZ53_33105, partial [Kofleriaceae bacterium]|nr:hypothetical protein [Kofleriaceae bacterium]
MRAGRVLLISVALHGALAAVLSQMVVEGKRVAAVRPPEPAPIEVAIIDSAPTLVTPTDVTTFVPAPTHSAASPTHIAPSTAHIEAGGNAREQAEQGTQVGRDNETDASGNGASTSGTNGSSLMRMRGAELSLDPGTAARIEESGRRELPAETKSSGLLSHEPGGKAAIYDRVTTVDVERDGTAHFHDKPDIDIKLKLPIPNLDVEEMRQDLGKLLTDWYADPYASTKFGRTQDLSNINLAVPGACDEWGSIWCDDPLAPEREKYAREQKKTNGSILGG